MVPAASWPMIRGWDSLTEFGGMPPSAQKCTCGERGELEWLVVGRGEGRGQTHIAPAHADKVNADDAVIGIRD